MFVIDQEKEAALKNVFSKAWEIAKKAPRAAGSAAAKGSKAVAAGAKETSRVMKGEMPRAKAEAAAAAAAAKRKAPMERIKRVADRLKAKGKDVSQTDAAQAVKAEVGGTLQDAKSMIKNNPKTFAFLGGGAAVGMTRGKKK